MTRKARIWREPVGAAPLRPVHRYLHGSFSAGSPTRPWHWYLPARVGYYEGTCRTQQDAISHVCWLISDGWQELPLSNPMDHLLRDRL